MAETNHLVHGPLHDRVTGMGRPPHLLVGQLDGHIGGQEVHLGPGHHHLSEAELTCSEDLVHDAAFLLA